MHQGQPSPSPRKTLQGPAKTALGKLNQLIGLNHRGCCLLGGDGNGSVGAALISHLLRSIHDLSLHRNLIGPGSGGRVIIRGLGWKL